MRGRNRWLGMRGGGLDGAPAPPAWAPDSLSGLKLWLTAGPTWCFSDAGGTVACGDGDAVYVWKDRSGGSRDVSQATLGNRPILRTSGGHWYVDFDGTDDYLTRAYTPGARVAFSAFAAVRMADNGSFPVVFTARDTTMEWRCSGAARQLQVTTNDGGAAVTDGTALTVGTDYAVGAVCDYAADTAVLYRGGSSVQTGADTSSGSSVTPSALTVGARSSGSIPWVGRIYGLVYCDAALSSGDAANLSTYLAGLYS